VYPLLILEVVNRNFLRRQKMATKKKAGKLASQFVLRKEYVFDEVPPWIKIDKVAWARIQALKTKFIKEVNAELAKGQQ
jgi:hypothetical protein